MNDRLKWPKQPPFFLKFPKLPSNPHIQRKTTPCPTLSPSVYFSPAMNTIPFSHGHSLPFSTPTEPSPKPQPCHHQTHFSHRSQTHRFQEALSPQNHLAFHHFLDPSMPTCPFFSWTFTASEDGSFRHCKHEVLVPVLWCWVRHSGAATVWGHHGARGTFISHLFSSCTYIA